MGKMGCKRRFNNKALSDVVGFIMILAIVIIAISIVLFWYTPYRDRMEAESQVKSLIHQFYGIDDSVTDLISQGKNATTFSRIAMNKGDINVLSGDERIVIYYTLVNDSLSNQLSDYHFIVDSLEDNDKSFRIRMYESVSVDAIIRASNLYDPTSYESQTETIDNSGVTITFNNLFIEDTINISLYDTDENNALFGKIWVFDIGALTYTLPSPFGDYKVSFQNGATHVVYAGVDPAIVESPTIINESDALFLQISSINPILSTAVSAPNTVKVSMAVNDSFPCEVHGNASFLKMQVWGNYFESWKIYFCNVTGIFNDISSTYTNTFEILGVNTKFSLSHTKIDTYVEGVT